jgi:hypothetical protein
MDPSHHVAAIDPSHHVAAIDPSHHDIVVAPITKTLAITTAMTGHRNDEINADGEDYEEVDNKIGAKVGGDCGERLQATHVRLLCSILYFFTVLFPHA